MPSEAIKALKARRQMPDVPLPGEQNTVDVGRPALTQLQPMLNDVLNNTGVRHPDSSAALNVLRALMAFPGYKNPVAPQVPGSGEPLL